MDVSLRPAAPADAARIADILLAARAAFLPYAPSPHTDDEVRAWVLDVLVPRETVTVASLYDRIAGIIAAHEADAITWITQLYLDPSLVGRGIGSRLLAHALATAPRPVRLYTFQQNAGARRFYERHGFAPIAFADGSGNEERCPDVLYDYAAGVRSAEERRTGRRLRRR
jgi:GNAT superfamily N-acetyltransferase